MADPFDGEHVESATRPRLVAYRPMARPNVGATIVAVVLGGVCALPVTMIILRFVSKEKFDQVANSLPDFINQWLR